VGVSSSEGGSESLVEYDDERLDHQDMAIEMADGFAEQDATGLATLDAMGRAAQLQAGQALYDYVGQIWANATTRVDPASRPEWRVVAGQRDLSNALVEQACRPIV
jgi:hypothetical protein